MTIRIFEDLADGQEISFDPATDVLQVQNAGVNAGFLLLDDNNTATANTRFHMDGGPFGGRDVFLLDVQPEELTQANFTFGGGGLVFVGDNLSSTANDNSANSLTGTAAGDFFMGMGGNDTLNGLGGDDLFSFFVNGAGSFGTDSINGGQGFDWLVLQSSEATMGVTINLQTGTLSGYLAGSSATLTSIEAVIGAGYADSIVGSSAANMLDGLSGNDTLFGGLGNDTLFGTSGNDFLDGEAGIDTALYEESSFGIDVDLATGFADDGSGFTDTLVSIENVIGSENDDHIAGNAGVNALEGADGGDELEGMAGNDTLIGGAGNDTLDGGAGNDRLVGGTGDDTYFVDSALDRVIEAPGGDNDTVITSVSMPLPANVENILFTGTASIIISGNAQNNVIGGGAADDTLSGGAGIDTVSYALATTAVTINLQSNVATGQGTDVLSGFENATGGSGADVLIGNSGKNVLDGSNGADTMRGGFGDDTYYVERASDVVVEASNSPGGLMLPGDSTGPADPGQAGISGITDTVIAAINYSLSPASLRFIENLTLSGAASRATGNALANKLTGNEGGDTLSGGGGNDTLNGGAGADSLKGDSGNDTLVWASTDAFDGGVGVDTLKVTGGNLNLTTVDNTKINNVEQIDLTGGGNNTLTLALDDVLAISSSTDTLKVLGNAGDVVHAAGFVQGADSGGFHSYTNGAAVLLVDTDVNVVI